VFSPGGAVARRTPDARVNALVEGVSSERLTADLAVLAGTHTRHSTSSGYREVLARTAKTLADLGCSVRKQRVRVGTGLSYNLIADKNGSDPMPRGRVVVSAHLDSVNWEDGAAAPAPGADDNGTGSAGILEMARILATAASRLDVRFVLFGGEEQGLFGSKHLVAGLTIAERGRIRAALNMDMIGSTNTATRTVLLEGAPLSVKVMDDLEAAATSYTKLAVERSLHAANSDHVPFIEGGIPAVLTIESADSTNDRVHSARDTLAQVDIQLVTEIVRMNVAFVAEAIGISP
jgi:Zn-dependent M28 family amino/carboxypeptidase